MFFFNQLTGKALQILSEKLKIIYNKICFINLENIETVKFEKLLTNLYVK